jgi:mannosyltransferase OCH1-like enzyme
MSRASAAMGGRPASAARPERDTAPIPKTIHQIWIQGAGAFPWRYRLNARTWRRQHPGWKYRLWDDRALRALIQSQAPALLPVYEAYENPTAQADVGRYVLLDALGGVYVDVDTECVRPVDECLREEGISLYVQVYDNPVWKVAPDQRLENVSNAFIACPPAHGIWREVFQFLKERQHPDPVWIAVTGPEMFSRCLAQYLARRDDVHFFTRHRIITAYYLPRHYMRWYAWKHRGVFAVHYNDSGRAHWHPSLLQRVWPLRT